MTDIRRMQHAYVGAAIMITHVGARTVHVCSFPKHLRMCRSHREAVVEELLLQHLVLRDELLRCK